MSLPQIACAKGWYAGLDVGQSKSDAETTEFVVGAPAAQDDGSDTGFRVRGGYQFSRFFAVDVGYVDFGDFKFDFNPSNCPIGVPQPCPFSTRTSIDGFFTNAIGRLPLGKRWALYAHLGWFNLNVKTGGGAVDDSGDMNGMQTGLGVGYHLTDHWELQLDYSEFDQLNLGLGLGGNVLVVSLGDTQLTSLGINYHW